MVAGKARPARTMMSYVVEDRKDNRLLHALLRDAKINPAGGTSSRAIGTASNVSPISDDSLKRSGDAMLGPFALNPQVFIITSNESDTLRIDENFGKYTSRVFLTGEGAAADNLEFIIGKDDGEGNTGKASFDGQLLLIDATLTTPITLIDGADISLPGGTNVLIAGGENALLVYDSTADKWNLIANSTSMTGGGPFLLLAGGTMVGDIQMDSQKLVWDTNSTFSAVSEIFLWEIDATSANDVVLFADGFFLGPKLMTFTEISTPGSALANQGRLYVKEVGGTHANLFYKDELGAETDLITDFAKTDLSNLDAVTAINTSLISDGNGIDNLGQFAGGWWDEVWARAYNFAQTKPVNATESGIGETIGSYIWFNNTNALDNFSFRWDDVESISFARTTGLTIRNPALLLSIIGASFTHTIQNLSNTMAFTNNSTSAGTKAFFFDGVGNSGEKIILTGTGGINTEFRFRTNQSTPTTDIAKIIFEGHDVGASDVNYAAIVGAVFDNTVGATGGTLALRVADTVDGVDTTFFLLDGVAHESRLLKPLDCNNLKLDDIGETTITDLTTVVGAAGDFLIMVDATDGLMKKVDATDFLGGAGAPFVDTTSIVEGSADPSKEIRFEVDGLTASTIRVLTPPDADITIAGINLAQSFSAAQTFNANVSIGNTFDILPVTDNGSDLGDTTHAFANAYINKLFFDITTKFIQTSGALDLIFEIPSLGSMFFRENGTPFWELDGANNIIIFSRDIELTTGEAIRANSTGEIGYFVTNTSVAVGSAGSLQMPREATSASTNAALNAIFGSEIGCMGVYNVASANINFAIKVNASEWVVFAMPDAGGTVISDHVT